MMNFFELLFWSAVSIILYIYVGYPLLLCISRVFVHSKERTQSEIYPKVTLLISCYNEENVIREKIENVLNLSYPTDKLEVMVVSDASTDKTDEIVGEYADKGIRLVRQDQRLGKTAGLNLAMQKASGDIIVFTDANAMFKTDAIEMLVRNFADRQVGYVVGEARYIDERQNFASDTESTYWRYEIFIKRMESRIHSVVGGDGAIYAVRKELYEPLLDTDINDFVNPMQIILQGFRGVYEPEAICWEKSAGDFKKEFYRKIRIVNRSFSGLWRVRSVINPVKSGIFSFLVVSHKLLRWLTFVFLATAGLSSVVLALQGQPLFQYALLLATAFVSCAYFGHLLGNRQRQYKMLYLPYYFLLVHIGSAIGISRSLKGQIQTTWTPTRGGAREEAQYFKWAERILLALLVALLCLSLVTVGALIAVLFFLIQLCYFFSIAILVYVYFIYPAIIGILSLLAKKEIRRGEITPRVTMLICAYNEESVIEEKIKNTLSLDYPSSKLRIVIASDGSTDQTNAIVRKYQNGRVTLMAYPERRGKIQVINDTVARIDDDIIVFSDANTMCETDVIKKIVRNFKDPGVGGVSADVILMNEEASFGKSESLYYRYERWLQKRESDFGSTIGADGGLYAIRRELYSPPAPDIILDDFVISMNVTKKGYRLIYDNEVVGYERNNTSYKTEFLRRSRVVAGAVQSVLQKAGVPSIRQGRLLYCYISHKLLRWLIPLVLIILFFANLHLMIATTDNLFAATFWGQVLFYILAVTDLFLADNPARKADKVTLIPFYFCLVNGAALYGLYKGVFNKQPVTWQKFAR